MTLMILGAFAGSQKAPVSFVMSVCPSARISAATTGRIPVKFDIGGIYKNLSRKFKFAYNRVETSGTLHEDLSKFYYCRRHKFAIKSTAF
jgi:hypothetical protein